MEASLPDHVRVTGEALSKNGHAAYIVGGAVRDIILGRGPKDWDIATDATPDEVEAIFDAAIPRINTIPTGKKYGTVTVMAPDSTGQRSPVEVTTFRSDGVYSDGRRPDVVIFSTSILEDLARRDFTINAMAYEITSGELVDPYGGTSDTLRKRITTVGNPQDRFREDALRMLRAVRFAAQLGFTISPNVTKAIKANIRMMKNVSAERVRDELNEILTSPDPGVGIELARSTGLLSYILPELCEGLEVPQGKRLARTVYLHSILAMERIEPALHLRLAALLHDIGKPRTYGRDEDGDVHFYNHQTVGAAMARSVLRRLKFSNEIIVRVSLLIENHMFHHEQLLSDKALRRLTNKVGRENILDLMKLRMADREATRPIPAHVRVEADQAAQELLSRIQEILDGRQPLTVRDLAIDGHDVMRILGIPPGPQVGKVLKGLLDAVLDDPALNTRETLETMVRPISQIESISQTTNQIPTAATRPATPPK